MCCICAYAVMHKKKQNYGLYTAMHCLLFLLQEVHFMAVLYAVDHGCLTVFVVEIILKWYHDFLAFWKSGWNILDFFIVAAAIVGPRKYLCCAF